jgi:hypothetical protein
MKSIGPYQIGCMGKLIHSRIVQMRIISHERKEL